MDHVADSQTMTYEWVLSFPPRGSCEGAGRKELKRQTMDQEESPPPTPQPPSSPATRVEIHQVVWADRTIVVVQPGLGIRSFAQNLAY